MEVWIRRMRTVSTTSPPSPLLLLPLPSTSADINKGAGLLMRVDFHNSHIVTTRYKDYYFLSASRNLQQGKERSRSVRVSAGLLVLEGFFF